MMGMRHWKIVYVNPALEGMPKLDSASVTLIRSFELSNSEPEKKSSSRMC